MREIQNWICKQKLIINIKDSFITHAGIPHMWSPEKAISRAQEIENVLQDNNSRKTMLSNLFNYENKKWDEKLAGVDRWISIINYFTRMRYINKNGKLEFKFKSENKNLEKKFKPWFSINNKDLQYNQKIFFGHWASLNGSTNKKNIIALDTGCVFGKELTCYCMEENKKYSVKAIKNYKEI